MPPLDFKSLLPAVQARLSAQGVGAPQFPAWLKRIDSETVRRERDGESDALIYYVLQSKAFTTLPPIEPALSAKALVERGSTPPDVAARLEAFTRARTSTERMAELREIAKGLDLSAEYARAMRFLYAKEFLHTASYAKRGHSTDTAITANYAVWNALSVLHASAPNVAISRVLIIGPGLDFVPRTGFVETEHSQSYQPFAVLDALLSLGFGGPDVSVQCYDINKRVVRFLQDFPDHPKLEIFSSPGDSDYKTYFGQLGRALGQTQQTGWRKSIEVRQSLAQSILAQRRNLLTEPGGSGFDLTIATNVLLYYEGPELTLALANIAAALKPGGYFIHNDLRPELDACTHAAGLQPVAARTIRISATAFDSFALYRR